MDFYIFCLEILNKTIASHGNENKMKYSVLPFLVDS